MGEGGGPADHTAGVHFQGVFNGGRGICYRVSFFYNAKKLTREGEKR